MSRVGNIMDEELLLERANKITKDLMKIIDKRKDVYDMAPVKPNIKIEIFKERCKHEGCPLDHTVIKITADFMLRDELLNIFRYLKRNNIPVCYQDNMFCIVLD